MNSENLTLSRYDLNLNRGGSFKGFKNCTRTFGTNLVLSFVEKINVNFLKINGTM